VGQKTIVLKRHLPRPSRRSPRRPGETELRAARLLAHPPIKPIEPRRR
jgi:hypothetical protein